MRLSPTSDALDAYHAERDAEERAALVASAAVRQAKEERDPLREVVALLVEKGDWHVLHLAAPRFAKPADGRVPRENDDSEAYVQALLWLLSWARIGEAGGRRDARCEPELDAAQAHAFRRHFRERPRRPLNTHLPSLEDSVAELHRELDRLAALRTQPAPFDPAQFARVGLLEAEFVRLRRRVRELEQAQTRAMHHRSVEDERSAGTADDEDPDATIRASPAPPPLPPLLPAIDLRPAPTPRPSDLLHPSSALPRIHAQDAQEQRLAQLAAELARAQDDVAERERAMDGLRAEIARLRGPDGA